ncbi:MAG: hypothetical protein IJK63_09155 [Oscillospiraceae bacterium]|nr:hypothetical protein [Oscillospiraceae bacterium]
MKKFVSILLILVLVLTLCACGGGSKGPKGTYVGYYYGKVFSTVTFNSDGTFTEQMEGEPDLWRGTWVMDSSNHITSTYDDGSHDYYTWDPKTDTLDWKGEGEIIYEHK